MIILKKKSLGWNAVLNSVRSVCNILFPLVTFPYVSRVLQVKGLGKYNFSNSIISYFLLIAGLGISTYAIREGAKYRNSNKKITLFSSQIFTINIYSTIISYILLILALVIFKNLRTYTICILIFSLEIFFTTLSVDWLYQIYEDYDYITIRSICFQIISIILMFLFVRNKNDYLIYASITVFSTVGTGIVNWMNAAKLCKIHLVKNVNLKKHLKPVLIIFASSIASMIYLNSDITILGLMKNDYIVGIYSVSTKVYQMVNTLMASLIIVTVPRLSLLIGQGKKVGYQKLLLQVVQTIAILTLPCSVGVFMISKEIVILISGNSYIRAVTSLRILCIALLFAVFTNLLTNCVLIPQKREKDVLLSTCISALVNLVLNILLIPHWGENAAAFSTVVAELVIFVMEFCYSKKFFRKESFSYESVHNFSSVLIGAISIVFVCILVEYWPVNSVLIKLSVKILLSIIMYFSVLIALKNKIFSEYIKRMKHK